MILDHLEQQLRAVVDEATFLSFIEAMAADFRDASTPWQNETVNAVLTASAVWGRKRLEGNPPRLDANPWQRCAAILLMGKWH